MASLFAELAARVPAVRSSAGPASPPFPPRGSAPIRTRPFLDLCSALLPVLAALGKGLAPARSDISSNLARLEAARAAASPPGAFDGDVRAISAAELTAVGGNADALHGSTSAAKALLWLARTLAFVGAVVEGVADTEGGGEGSPPSLTAVAREAYAATLRPFHGPVTGKAVSAALFFAPSRAAFWKAVMVGGGSGGDVGAAAGEARAFMVAFNAILADLAAYLREAGLDDPTPVR